MYGGLKRTASRMALVAAAGVLSTSAYAADLGGDCCADLEERVAELEATTARKGNRKMSLTISGQVNKQITYWSAPNTASNNVAGGGIVITPGSKSGVYFGLDNQNSSTRFGFTGSAKVTPTLSAGFSILIDVVGGARSNAVTQINEESDVNATTGFRGDYGLRMRDANWWLESSQVGRLTVGRLVSSGAVGTIDLGGIGVIASDSLGLQGGGFRIGNAVNGQNSFNNWTDNSGDFNQRVDGVKWTSPTLAGFVVSAAIGESGREGTITAIDPVTGVGIDGGRMIGIDLKYAGEFSGVRLAAGIGWERGVDEQLNPSNRRTTTVGGGLSLLHVASGLFAQGNYIRQSSETGAVEFDATKFVIQAGISQNFFGVGKTNLYGEYVRSNGWLDLHNFAATGDSRVSTWGLGVVQNLDAAAMEIYVGYRNHSFSATGAAPVEDFSTLTAGARVKF
jgi:hypothetical protein